MIPKLNPVLLLGSLERYKTNQKAHFHALTAAFRQHVKVAHQGAVLGL
jgi:hypothetical protein